VIDGLRRRRYKVAAFEEAGGGYLVILDEQGARTPAGWPFVVPTAALAEAIAAEWEAQAE
jgi:chaperone required for assembly of F1-ATPase